MVIYNKRIEKFFSFLKVISSNMTSVETLGWVGGIVLDKWLAYQTPTSKVHGSTPGWILKRVFSCFKSYYK